MYNRKELLDITEDWEAEEALTASKSQVEETPPRFTPNWMIGVVLVGFVGVGMYLAFNSPTPAVAEAQSVSSGERIEQAPFVGDQRTYKRANWAPPGKQSSVSSAPRKNDKSSRIRTGLLYSDFRQAMEDGVQSPLVDIPSGDQWAFDDLRKTLERAGSLSQFQIQTEQKTEFSRVIRVLAQGSPKFIGRVELVRRDGRWVLKSVLEVAP